MRIYLDMDGVCCDFVGGVLRLFKKDGRIDDWPKGQYDVAKVAGISEKDLWQSVDNAGHEFWRNLKEEVWFKPLYSGLKKRADQGLYFLTSPSKHESCLAGKCRWLRDRFGDFFDEVVYTRHKQLLANADSVLIDDDPRNIEKFIKAGGKGILVPRPWNDAEEPLNIADYVLKKLEE